MFQILYLLIGSSGLQKNMKCCSQANTNKLDEYKSNQIKYEENPNKSNQIKHAAAEKRIQIPW